MKYLIEQAFRKPNIPLATRLNYKIQITELCCHQRNIQMTYISQENEDLENFNARFSEAADLDLEWPQWIGSTECTHFCTNPCNLGANLLDSIITGQLLLPLIC